VEKLAQTAKPGHGVIAVPAFTGLGAPYWDAEARGAIFGLTRDSGLAEIAEALFDACALQTRDLIEAMGRDAPGAFDHGGELRIDGGMARSRWFAGRLADLTGLPTAPAAFPETTALGAALFASLGAGLYESLEATERARPPVEAAKPRLRAEERDERYRQWRAAVALCCGQRS
jgi:glycerol kinase